MRRALGLEGGVALRAQERTESAPRTQERFPQMHAGHKRRFVQDGEVPVTVVSGRRDGFGEAAPHRGASAATAPSRLEAAESALAQESAARQQAERAIAEAQATIHDLQTKLGHAELARIEAAEGLRHAQDSIASLRAELGACEERLHTAQAEARVRRRRAPVLFETEPDDAAPQDALDRVPPAPRAPAERRARAAGNKPAHGSKLVRWWIKDETRQD